MTSAGSFASFAPGKVILLGEHGVVYGQPALAAPLSWGVTARGVSAARCSLELPSQVRGAVRSILQTAFQRAARLCGQPKIRVRLESDLPPSMGLGSSAAVSVACAKLLLNASGRPANPSEVLRVAGEMEGVFHGTPSGVDHTCSAQGRMILFRRANGPRAARVRPVRCQRPVKILVALVGSRQATRLTVAGLAERHARWPIRYQRIFKEMGRVVEEGARAVESGDLEALGDAMSVNQGLLTALQLSSDRIQATVQLLRKMGALGAKLTGAGGDGGAVIGLFLEPEPVVAKLARQDIRCFVSQIAGPRAL